MDPKLIWACVVVVIAFLAITVPRIIVWRRRRF